MITSPACKLVCKIYRFGGNRMAFGEEKFAEWTEDNNQLKMHESCTTGLFVSQGQQ